MSKTIKHPSVMNNFNSLREMIEHDQAISFQNVNRFVISESILDGFGV